MAKSNLCPDIKDDVGSLKELKARYEHVPKNEKGGVMISDALLEETFAVLAAGKEKFSARDLEKRLTAFFPDLDAAAVKLLLGDAKQMNLSDLQFLLKDNQVANYDPPLQAFRAFADERGMLDVGRVHSMHTALGLEPPSEEECRVLVECAAADRKDITFSDFRKLSAYADSREARPSEKLRPAHEEYR